MWICSIPDGFDSISFQLTFNLWRKAFLATSRVCFSLFFAFLSFSWQQGRRARIPTPGGLYRLGRFEAIRGFKQNLTQGNWKSMHINRKCFKKHACGREPGIWTLPLLNVPKVCWHKWRLHLCFMGCWINWHILVAKQLGLLLTEEESTEGGRLLHCKTFKSWIGRTLGLRPSFLHSCSDAANVMEHKQNWE